MIIFNNLMYLEMKSKSVDEKMDINSTKNVYQFDFLRKEIRNKEKRKLTVDDIKISVIKELFPETTDHVK